jgi:preprotein translocase subunit YajC
MGWDLISLFMGLIIAVMVMIVFFLIMRVGRVNQKISELLQRLESEIGEEEERDG